MRIIAQTRGFNFPVYTNHFIPGTVAVIDRHIDLDWIYIDWTLGRAVLTYLSRAQSGPPSSYMRLNGVDTTSNLSMGIFKITNNHATAAIGPWTGAEAQHAGLFIFNTDPDNNYGLMISAAASVLGQRDIQLIKQVAGVETVLDTDTYGSIDVNAEYLLTLERVAGVLTGKVYNMQGTLLSTVSASDSSLSSGNTGTHAYSVTYQVRGINAV